MIENNKCDGCGNELKEVFSHSFSSVPHYQERNFYQNFLVKKGKDEEFKTEFRFCGNCQKEYENWLIEQSIQELKQKNIANSQILTYRFFESDFSQENWQKYQTALTENIKRHIGEWQIKEVNYRPYYHGKPKPKPYEFHPDKWGEIEKRVILVHQSAKLEYDQNVLDLKKWWEPRKVYFETDFLPEKWTEIKNSLTSYQKKESHQEKANSPIPTLLVIFGIFIAVILLICWFKEKNSNNA